PELDVRVPRSRDVHARALDHPLRHVEADHLAARADRLRGEDQVEARTAAEIEHRVSGPDVRVREGIAAAVERHVTDARDLAIAIPGELLRRRRRGVLAIRARDGAANGLRCRHAISYRVSVTAW